MKKRVKRRSVSTVLYTVFWLLIIGAFTGLAINQSSRYNYYQNELQRVTDDLEFETMVYESLMDQMLYYDSDAYIEQLAREQLRFVRSDEIVFINLPD